MKKILYFRILTIDFSYANYNFLKKVTGKNCCFCQNTTQEQLTFPVAAPA